MSLKRLQNQTSPQNKPQEPKLKRAKRPHRPVRKD